MVPVAFICDSHYVIPTVVAITSLICNKNPDTYYDIYIIAADLSEMEIEKFYEFRESKADIHIIKVSLKKFEDIPKFIHITSTSCFKFDLPDLIPHQDKVLYLDGDVIIQKDLSDLFEADIDDYYAGVIKDIGMVDNDLHIKDYFNSGVMLLNLKLMRKNNTSMALFNNRKSAEKLTFMDQDCFNIVFDKKVRLLPIIYNCCYNILMYYRGGYTLDYINKYFGTNYSSWDNIKEASCIIHLASYEKPWIYFDSDFVREWDEYFKKSPFRLHKLKRKSLKLRRFIDSHSLTKISYGFFQYWRNNGFKFAMGKIRKKLLKNISG
ncbi:MAG: glycosyltransferase family 8 protein [Smithella sp.]|jgi:lipopolysaccharide biosynthesis glycosyltransferase